jgi:MFS family permease
MLLLGLLAFVAFGFVLVLVGVNQAEMARDLSLDLSRSGLLGACLSLGLGVGVTAAGPCADRWPRRPLFVASTGVAALALLTVDAQMTYVRTLAHVTVLGIGCGFYDTLLNAATVDRFRAHASAALATLHSGATAGAVAGPFLIAWANHSGHWTASFHALGWVFAALMAWGVITPLPAAPRRDRSRAAGDRVLAPSPVLLLALGVIGFAYVGAENGLTLFAVPWATGGRGESEATGQAGIGAFWLGLLLGRLSVVAWRRTLGLPLLAACGAAGASLLGAAAYWDQPPMAALMVCVGFVLGPVYPVLIGAAARRFPHAAGTATGLVGGAGALGGFVVPWLAGVLGDRFGIRSAILGLAVTLLGIALAALGLLHAPGRPRDLNPVS